MGGKRSVRKPRPKKKSGKKNTRKRAHKELSVKEPSTNKSKFHKKYDEYVTKLANKLDIHPNEASSHLGSAMEKAFNGLMLSEYVGNVSNDEYFSLRDDELQSTLHPSLGASKKKKKCNSCGSSRMNRGTLGKGKCGKGRHNRCKSCGKMKIPLSLIRNMRSIRKPMNKRTFHLTPKALRHDNIKTNMSGYSETRICESHTGSPLKCRTMIKKY